MPNRNDLLAAGLAGLAGVLDSSEDGFSASGGARSYNEGTPAFLAVGLHSARAAMPLDAGSPAAACAFNSSPLTQTVEGKLAIIHKL
jgi:hypothetical protein